MIERKRSDAPDRGPLLQLIYYIVHTVATDEFLVKKYKLPLATVQRYREAVEKFYGK